MLASRGVFTPVCQFRFDLMPLPSERLFARLFLVHTRCSDCVFGEVRSASSSDEKVTRW